LRPVPGGERRNRKPVCRETSGEQRNNSPLAHETFPQVWRRFSRIAAPDEMLAHGWCLFHSVASDFVEAGTLKQSAVAPLNALP
jgi:hypothetical protein